MWLPIPISRNGPREGWLSAGTKHALPLRCIPGPVVERGFYNPVMAKEARPRVFDSSTASGWSGKERKRRIHGVLLFQVWASPRRCRSAVFLAVRIHGILSASVSVVRQGG